MLTFYIDEQLTQEEAKATLDWLKAEGVKMDALDYRRIPFVFPLPTDKTNHEKMIDVFKQHLINAGVPVGVQSMFIVPKEGLRWAILLQETFYRVSGYYPMVIQQWQRTVSDNDDEEVIISRRDYLNLIDMHGAMGG